MAKPPARHDVWMKLYVADYLGDTMHLTMAQHGAYLLLIMATWKAGGALPDDDHQLAAIVRAGVKEWRAIRPVIERFFIVADGDWRHKRVTKELAEAEGRVVKRSVAGKAGAVARWQSHANAIGNATADANGKRTEIAMRPQCDQDGESESEGIGDNSYSESSNPTSLAKGRGAGEGRKKAPVRPGIDALDPADFLAYAAEKAPGVDVRRELERARNWTLQHGKKHRDAAAFFRNWLLKAGDDRRAATGPPARADGLLGPGF